METEERARQMGWTPQEEFRGNPDNWVDAETFVERAETSLPIAKGTIKKLESTITELKKEFQHMSEFQRQAHQRELEATLSQLRKREIEAVEEGDTKKFNQVRIEIDELTKNQPAPLAQKQSNGGDREAVKKEWIADNPWYAKDVEMAAFAHQIDQWLMNTSPSETQREHLNKITQYVKEKYPERFDNSGNRKAPASVEGGDSLVPVKGGGKKSYSALPAEAKSLCDKWVKEGWMTRDQFLKDYQWE